MSEEICSRSDKDSDVVCTSSSTPMFRMSTSSQHPISGLPSLPTIFDTGF